MIVKELLERVKLAANEAVLTLRSTYLKDAQVKSDFAKDLKTIADEAAQERIIEILGNTRIPILAEEGEHEQKELDDIHWIVDPLDGTINFSRGFPMAAVSIALWKKGEPVLGVVQNVFNDDLFEGVVGESAYLNGEKIEVSSVEERTKAILTTGFPSGRNYTTDSLMKFVTDVQEYKKIRMLGSASLMLAQVAAGRFDVYREDDIYLWDVAAGLALIRAAGGDYRMDQGSGLFKLNVYASNKKLIDK